MKARIRNQTDEVVGQFQRGASVADQLSFSSWPPEAKTIARRAVALEIEKQADEGSTADAGLGEAIEAVKVHLGELKSHIEKFVKLVVVPGAGDPGSDQEVARSSMLAELAELDDAVGELAIAAEAEPE